VGFIQDADNFFTLYAPDYLDLLLQLTLKCYNKVVTEVANKI